MNELSPGLGRRGGLGSPSSNGWASVDIVLRALEERECRPKGSYERGEWVALCPAHDDRSPSLSVGYKDGKTLLYCHTGCSQEAVLDALALTWNDLFDDET